MKTARHLAFVTGFCALAGCAPPPMFSENGARLGFERKAFSYARPGAVATRCAFDEALGLATCEDGTRSPIVTAGLPFEGLLLVKFDGQNFFRNKPGSGSQ
ncbi:MAG: hypothetical protein AAGD04_07570 [Pseudomonadota bacterium]